MVPRGEFRNRRGQIRWKDERLIRSSAFKGILTSVVSRSDQPRRHRLTLQQGGRFSRQQKKNRLANILGQMMVTNLATTDGVNQIRVPGHQLSKSLLVVLFHKGP